MTVEGDCAGVDVNSIRSQVGFRYPGDGKKVSVESFDFRFGSRVIGRMTEKRIFGNESIESEL